MMHTRVLPELANSARSNTCAFGAGADIVDRLEDTPVDVLLGGQTNLQTPSWEEAAERGSAASLSLSGHETRMSATGGIVAPAGTNILGATLATAGPATAISTCVGSGTRIAAAAHAARAAARSVAGRGAGSSSARTRAGSSTRSARSTRLRMGVTDRRTGKQRTHGHRENCLSHVSTPFDVIPVKPSCVRMFLTADDKLSHFVRNDVV